MIINQNNIFFGKQIDAYTDWGTAEQWHKYRAKFKTYFIDLDGVIFKSSAQFFTPRWENAEPIQNNVEALKKMIEDSRIQIIFTTSRPENYRKITEEQFKKLELNHSALVMGCLHANRVIINDFSGTTKYPTCEAINIVRDSEDLHKYMYSGRN